MEMLKKKKAFTLLEMIFVVVIAGTLSVGTFKAFEALYIRSAKAKAISDLSLQSQIVLNQLSAILYNRVPNSVIAYNPTTSGCAPIEEASGDYKVLEWLSLDVDQFLDKKYSGFVDMQASSRPDLNTPDTQNDLNITRKNLLLTGAFGDGSEELKACAGAFGWHGNSSDLSHGISGASTDTITFSTAPDTIYEKYYITNGAYAIARGEDIDTTASCIASLGTEVDDNTLFLFYNYYPYNSETYCVDGGSGGVSILAQNVKGFRASYVNDVIRLSIDMEKEIRGADNNDVTISKQKAVF
jgi:prepilin-type N-terminal cleavage/methylation domain-containing protein